VGGKVQFFAPWNEDVQFYNGISDVLSPMRIRRFVLISVMQEDSPASLLHFGLSSLVSLNPLKSTK
jgi:hypothetical protein